MMLNPFRRHRSSKLSRTVQRVVSATSMGVVSSPVSVSVESRQLHHPSFQNVHLSRSEDVSLGCSRSWSRLVSCCPTSSTVRRAPFFRRFSLLILEVGHLRRRQLTYVGLGKSLDSSVRFPDRSCWCHGSWTPDGQGVHSLNFF